MELVGLCASAVLWLSNLYNKGLYPYAGVMAKRKGVYHYRTTLGNIQ